MSRWIEYTPSGETYKDVGLGPDVFAQITAVDEAADMDTILERAIEVLGG